MACGLLVAGAVASVVPAAASARLVGFAHGYALANSTVTVVHGTPDGAGGCVLPQGKVTLAPGQRAIEVRENSLNTATCDAVVEQGVPPASSLVGDATVDTAAAGYGSAHAGGGLDAFGRPVAAGSSARAGVKARAAYAYGAGYEKDWWEDPLGIDVNKTISHLGFHYGGGCVHNPVSWSADWFWYTTSGWSIGAHDNRGDASCTLSYSSSYAHFHNGAFCATADVDTYYNRTVVYGNPNGSLSASWNSYNTGAACKSLLSFNRTIVRTA